jgi:glutathione synthase/RimK-type ligase-like ATP-grasp enzyme
MITIGVVKRDLKNGVIKENSFNSRFIDLLNKNNIPYQIVKNWGGDEFWRKIKKSKLFFARYRGTEEDLALMQAYLPEIERKGVKTLPNFNNVYHCGDKLRLAAFFEANKIPSPKTYAAFSSEEVDQWVKHYQGNYPVVVKTRKGFGSRNVALAENPSQLKKLASILFARGVRDGSIDVIMKGHLKTNLAILRSYTNKKLIEYKRYVVNNFLKRSTVIENTCLIIQEFLPNNSYDTRITVIGNRAFAFMRENRPNDFRASGSGSIIYDQDKIDENFIKIAFDISSKFKFQTMAYDFIYDNKQNPVLIEMNYTYVDTAVQACSGFWTKDGKYYDNMNRLPQYYQLVDALEEDNLKY